MPDSNDAAITQQAHRRVTWKRVEWGCKINIIFGLAWFIGWGTFALVKEPPVWDHVILQKNGVPGSARLISINRTSITVNKQYIYSIELGFNDRKGRPYRANLWSHDPLFIARLKPERPVAIEYDPGKPSRCRFAGDTIGFMDIISILSCIAGLSLFTGSYYSARRRLQLLRNGTMVKARVTRVIATSQARKSSAIMNVRYEFTPAEGRPAAGFYKTTQPPKEGDEILVVYDSGSPRKNAPA